ncbi:hypothetical protein N9F54_00435 [Actinomycetota bacterium]|nr:hypothetical protein [Actinomycetota bacterium]
MPSSRGSFPHPVLDHTDDVNASCEVFNINVTPNVEDVEINFQVRMTDPQIQALINNGEAKYSFRWQCGSTIGSGSLDHATATPMADSTRYTSWIDQRSIRGKVSVSVSVIAAQEIPTFHLDSQHADYGDANFHLYQGDLIADFLDFEFDARKLYDPLNPPIGSCFEFVPQDGLKKGLKIHFDSDEHVLVAFPPDVFNQFKNFANQPEMQISLAVLPALMETIVHIRKVESENSDEELSDIQWARAIKDKIREFDSEGEKTPFELAQKILENPIDRFLSAAMEDTEEDQ